MTLRFCYPLYVLAGGQSRRFGTNKARAQVDGLALIQHIEQQLSGYTSSFYAVSTATQRYDDLGIETLADAPTFEGPIAGLLSALQHARQERGESWIWLTSCDLIYPCAEWLEPLAHHAHPPYTAVLYHDPIMQPMFGLYHTQMLQYTEHLAPNDSMRSWIRQAPHYLCHPPASWPKRLGCNTQDALKAQLKAHHGIN